MFYFSHHLFTPLFNSKMVSGSTLNTVITTWMPVWNWANWWGMAGTSTSLRPVVSSSKWLILPSMASCSPLSKKSANTHSSWLSSSNTLHRNTGTAHLCLGPLLICWTSCCLMIVLLLLKRSHYSWLIVCQMHCVLMQPLQVLGLLYWSGDYTCMNWSKCCFHCFKQLSVNAVEESI